MNLETADVDNFDFEPDTNPFVHIPTIEDHLVWARSVLPDRYWGLVIRQNPHTQTWWVISNRPIYLDIDCVYVGPSFNLI